MEGEVGDVKHLMTTGLIVGGIMVAVGVLVLMAKIEEYIWQPFKRKHYTKKWFAKAGKTKEIISGIVLVIILISGFVVVYASIYTAL